MRFFPQAIAKAAFVLALCPVGLSAGDSDDLSPDAEKYWKRHPVFAVPQIDTPPRIDGEVNRAEWKAAGQLGPLLAGKEGIVDELKREVFVACDDEYLYIAWILERPEGARIPDLPGKTGRLGGIEGDSVRLGFDVGRGSQLSYEFVVHANGAFADGIFQAGEQDMDFSWNTEWEKEATLTELGWQGEAAIPFSAFGLEGPPEVGTVWGFDFTDARLTPSELRAHWSYRGGHEDEIANFGVLVFGKQPAAVRFTRTGEAGDGLVVGEFEIVNPGATPVEATIDLALKKRADQPGSPFFEHIEEGMDTDYDRGEVEFYTGATLDALIEDASRAYAALEGGNVSDVLSVEAGQSRRFGLLLKGGTGEYLFEYQIREGSMPLMLGASVFSVAPPLEMHVAPFWLYSRHLEVQVDLSHLDLPNGGEVHLALKPGDGDEVLQERILPIREGTSMVEDLFPVEGITPGYFLLTATVSGPDGEEIASLTRALERAEDPVWYGNNHGNKVSVPHPWTPLTAGKDGVVEVWNRRYDLGGFFPTALRAGEHEILAAPTDFRLKVNGRVQDWEVRSLVLEEANDATARYRAELVGPDAILKGTVEIEFDGFAWYEMEIQGKGDAFEIDSLYLELEVVPERAVLCDAHRGGIGGHSAGRVIEAAGEFTPYQWIGDEEGGVAFIAEGPVNWRLKEPGKTIELTPATASDPARLRVNMIDHAVIPDGPLELAFGLQATPIRKAPSDLLTHVWQINGPVTDEAYYKNISEQGGKVVSFHSGWKSPIEIRNLEFGGWPTRPSVPERDAALREAVRLANKYGLKTLLYTGWGVDTGSEEWRNFGHEFVRKPIENSSFNTYRQSAGLKGAYADYMAWAFADLIEEYGVDGVLWDSTANFQADANISIGNGYLDENGELQPTFPVRAHRELFRRIYTLVHGEIKDDGIIINHPGSIWVINAFSDIHHRGEGNPMHVEKLRDAWKPLEVYRASYSGKPFGLASLGMNKNYRKLPMRMNQHHAVTLLHGDIGKSAGGAFALNENLIRQHQSYAHDKIPLPSLWQARLWLPMDGGEKRYYYYREQELPVTLRPESLLSSVFQSNDRKRALVVVSNLDGHEVPDAEIILDVAKLGMNGPDTLHAQDAITNDVIAVHDGVFHVDIEPERFRVIKVWTE